MTKIVTIEYTCDVCGSRHTTEKAALKCEKVPIKNLDKDVKIGDKVTFDEVFTGLSWHASKRAGVVKRIGATHGGHKFFIDIFDGIYTTTRFTGEYAKVQD